jgi:hypothetical protein
MMMMMLSKMFPFPLYTKQRNQGTDLSTFSRSGNWNEDAEIQFVLEEEFRHDNVSEGKALKRRIPTLNRNVRIRNNRRALQQPSSLYIPVLLLEW